MTSERTIGTEQIIISSGSRSVSISKETRFRATLYVNCTPENLGNITTATRKFSALQDAREWAKAVLEA
jgi:hypothetical protein